MTLAGLLPTLAGTDRTAVLSFVLFGAGFGLLNAPVNHSPERDTIYQ
ncbi:hypothetical protein G3I36_06380 [Streptomyces sp. SID10362]|nr:hypothetical protein [Streptomyces sp. SID10362]NDZ70679.1 hypothetical protein [Streptomyces sp. SID10362]